MSRSSPSKKRLCCLMNPLGACAFCEKVVCANHGNGTHVSLSMPSLMFVKCRSRKCNAFVQREKELLERRRHSLLEAAGISRPKNNNAGKALLDRITSQKVNRSISKIHHRKDTK